MRIEVAFHLPREARTVALVRAVVTNALVLSGVKAECVEDIRLAVSEACTNVVRHARDGDEYEIWVRVYEDRCEIGIKDVGVGFDVDAVVHARPAPGSAGGRGVAIMQAVMDSVQFESEPAEGTIVHLVKALSMDDHGTVLSSSTEHRA
ncbi:MAG TPA: ATP-binding protein [Acidimicrobiales bacterium]|nr:ATP-binding protein [Acidimicrobiales bacterium]